MSLNPIFLITSLLGLPVWLSYVTIFSVLFYVWATWTYSYWEKLGIPYLKPVPLLGNMLHNLKKGFHGDVEIVKNCGKVVGLFEGRTPVLLIADPVMIRQICVKDFDSFVNRRTEGLPFNEEFMSAVSLIKDNEWKGTRSIITPTFSGSKMKKMIGLINECCHELVDSLGTLSNENNGEIETKYLCGCFTMDVIARTMFGINVSSMKEGKNSEFVKHARSTFDGFSIKDPIILACFIFPKFGEILHKTINYGVFPREALQFFNKTVMQILNMRSTMKQKPVDFLQLLIDAHKEQSSEPDVETEKNTSIFDQTLESEKHFQDWRNYNKRALSQKEILSNSLIFFLAGYETTATAMSWMMFCLALNPDCQEKLRREITEILEKHGNVPSYKAISEMQYLDQVFSETLRLYPPVQRFDRICNHDCTIEGVPLQKGMVINVGIWAIHRNEEYWPEPEKFDPERFSPENKANILPYTYLPFGVGPRNCIGMRLAILEAKTAMVHAVKNFEFYRADKTEYPPKLKNSGFSAPEDGKLFVGVKPLQ